MPIDDERLAARVRCAIDPCHFYWHGRDDQAQPFASNGARASEPMGAMLYVQLDRLDGMIAAMRSERQQVLAGTTSLGSLGLRRAPPDSPDHDCATQSFFTLPSAAAATAISSLFPGVSPAGRGGIPRRNGIRCSWARGPRIRR